MIDFFIEMFTYTFLVRAFIVGLLVSLCASLLGVSLVLKNYSMIGDGLSRVGFLSLAIATAFNVAPLMVSIPVVVIAAFLLLRLSDNSKIKGDAAIALVSTSALAIGVIILSQTTGMNTDVCNFMFGSILVMKSSDVVLSIVLSAVVLCLFVLFYNKIFAITFDENYASATGTKTDAYNMLIALLTAITIVLGMRMMGALLISSLIIFPALTSMRLFKKFKSVIVSAGVISVLSFVIGMSASFHFASPTGASVVIVNVLFFILFSIICALKGLVKKKHNVLMLLVSMLLFVGCASTDEVKTKTLANVDLTSESVNTSKSVSIAEESEAETLVDKEVEVINSVETIPDDLMIIKEKMFVAQIQEIYTNREDYIGKRIKYQGFYHTFFDEQNNEMINAIVRYGPGCCGDDFFVGFEVSWIEKYPEEDDWVEVSGIVESYEYEGEYYLRVQIEALDILDERGNETVYY